MATANITKRFGLAKTSPVNIADRPGSSASAIRDQIVPSDASRYRTTGKLASTEAIPETRDSSTTRQSAVRRQRIKSVGKP